MHTCWSAWIYGFFLALITSRSFLLNSNANDYCVNFVRILLGYTIICSSFTFDVWTSNRVYLTGSNFPLKITVKFYQWHATLIACLSKKENNWFTWIFWVLLYSDVVYFNLSKCVIKLLNLYWHFYNNYVHSYYGKR